MEQHAHITQQQHHVDIQTHELEPHGRLRLGLGEHTLVVQEGILYMILESDEIALVPGDEVVVRGEHLRAAWNAGSDLLRVAELSTH
jgi:hypothetical protein